MAEKFKLLCHDCDFEYSYCSGGARRGSLRTHFCFDCLIPSLHFSAYQSPEPPRYMSYMLMVSQNIKADILESDRETCENLITQILTRYNPKTDAIVEPQNDLERKYLDPVNNEFKKALTQYNHQSIPTCNRCETQNVFLMEKKACPLCGSAKSTTIERCLID